jgi:GrpB-like predicted nucleotidyltransferase (UPF0157 family)
MEEVVLSPYNPQWVNEYRVEKHNLMAALSDIMLGIEHIGSTSVLNLPAKPVIDIMVGVGDLSKLKDDHKERLSRLGYEFVDHPQFPERRFFRRGARRAGTHHLHIYKFEGTNWSNHLMFRNYLRENPDAMQQYGNLKRQLSGEYKYDRAMYTKAKEPFIREILAKAKAAGKFGMNI